MKNLIWIALLCFASLNVAGQEIKENGELKVHRIDGKEYYIHIVEKGNTLYAISRRYAISVEELKKENPRLTKELTIGDRLLIPLKEVKRKDLEESPDIDGNFLIHEVQKKNTLYSISKEYNVEIADITSENPQITAGLKRGMKLKIPVAKIKAEPNTVEYVEPAASSPYVTHQVQPKETLYALSKLYEVSVDSIKQVNNGLIGGLKEDQLINIPILKTYELTLEDTISYDSTAIKEEYQVSLLLPFYLDLMEQADDTASYNANEAYKELFSKAQYAIDFYQGFLMAADTMKNKGLRLKLNVFDSANDTAKVEEILKTKDFDKNDLIIGPLYLDGFMKASDYAKTNNINIVCPVKQSNKILLGNNLVSKVATSSPLVLKYLGDYLADTISQENLLLLYPDHIKERQNAATLKKSFIANRIASAIDSNQLPIVNELIWDVSDAAKLEAQLDSSRSNIIVVPTEDQPFVTATLTTLNMLEDYNLTVIGLESWKFNENIDVDYLHNMNVHLPMTEYVDNESAAVKLFENKYYDSYQSPASEFSFLGYDVGMYYLKMLHLYGLNFEIMFLGFQDVQLAHKFEFFKTGIESGYENKSIYMVKYSDFRLQEVK